MSLSNNKLLFLLLVSATFSLSRAILKDRNRSSRRSLFAFGAKDQQFDGKGIPSNTTDWVLGDLDATCDEACPSFGFCNGGVNSPMGGVATQAEIDFLGSLLGFSCVVDGENGFVPPGIEGEDCFVLVDGLEQEISCSFSPGETQQNICCCGNNCPLSGE